MAAAEALVTAEPLREGGWAVLIEALAGAHRTAEALRAFQRAADALADAGLEPSSRLRDAEQVALRGDTARDRAAGVRPGSRHVRSASARRSCRRRSSGATTTRASSSICSSTPVS